MGHKHHNSIWLCIKVNTQSAGWRLVALRISLVDYMSPLFHIFSFSMLSVVHSGDIMSSFLYSKVVYMLGICKSSKDQYSDNENYLLMFKIFLTTPKKCY